MTAEWLLGWWNVIYLLPFGLALLYLFAYAASGWTFGDADADVGADADVEVDADVDADADVDVDAGSGLDHDVDQDVHAHGLKADVKDIDADSDVSDTKSALAALTWLGVGKVPLSILLMVLFLTFGSIGFITNQFLYGWFTSGLVALISLPVATLGSFGITAILARGLARWLPMTESSARYRRELVGLRATSIFAIDGTHGMALVRDPSGDRYQLACRTLPGREPIAGGTEVVLVKYAPEQGIFYVVPSNLGDQASRPSGEIAGHEGAGGSLAREATSDVA